MGANKVQINYSKVAFVCWRPFQLMQAVNMVINNVEDVSGSSDIYLLNLDCLSKIRNSLEITGLFNNIYYFEDIEKDGYFRRKARKARDHFFPEKAIKRYLRKDVDLSGRYEKVIASGWMMFFVCLYYINPKAEIILMDDGIASLMGDFRETETSKNMRLFLHLTGKGIQKIEVKKMYLNAKELMYKEPNYPVFSMPYFTKDTLERLKKIFEYSEIKGYTGKKLVYLSADFPGVSDSGLHKIHEILGKYKDMTIVRRHPAEKKQKELDMLDTDAGENLWELQCAECVNDGMVLIAIGSTAQYTPYIYYKNSPTLIYLYKVVGMQLGRIENFLIHFSKIYPGKIYIPESIEEFDCILKEVSHGDEEERDRRYCLSEVYKESKCLAH